MESIKETIARHERIALQLSGGRDSIACLFYLRPYLEHITVYTLNTGAMFPETRETLEQLRPMIPHYVEIQGNQPFTVEHFGYPSDLVPVSHTPFAHLSDQPPSYLLQSRYDCCARVIMAPMHQRMIDDGITLIIRGQRAIDRHKSPIKSGETVDGIEFLYPINEWSDVDVMAYLAEVRAPIPRFYEYLSMAPDCMTCSAWWDERRAAYLAEFHPEAFETYQTRLDFIRQATQPHIEQFNGELIVRSNDT